MEDKKTDNQIPPASLDKEELSEEALAENNPELFISLKTYEAESKSLSSEAKIGTAIAIWFFLIFVNLRLADLFFGGVVCGYHDLFGGCLGTSLVVTPWWISFLEGISFFLYGLKKIKDRRTDKTGFYDFLGPICLILGLILLIGALLSGFGLRDFYYDFIKPY